MKIKLVYKILLSAQLVAFNTYAAGTSTGNEEVFAGPPSEFELERMQPRQDLEMLSTNLAGENISLADGGLSFSATDIIVPIENDQITLSRSYSRLSGFNYRNVEAFGDWQLDLPRIESTGLIGDTRNSLNLSATTACSNLLWPGPVKAAMGQMFDQHEYWNGAKLIIPNKTSGQIVDQPELGKYSTKENFQILCKKDSAGKEFFQVRSPDGKTYTLAQRKQTYQKTLVKKFKGASRVNISYLVSSINDRFGNSVKYSYLTDGSLSTVEYIPLGKQSQLIFNINYSNKLITSIQSQGSSWFYSYTGNNLSKVTLPDQRFWTYEFIKLQTMSPEVTLAQDAIEPFPTESLSARSCAFTTTSDLSPSTISVKHPDGASVYFDLKLLKHGRTEMPADQMQYRNAVATYNINGCYAVIGLSSKKIVYDNGKSYSWNYTYSNNGTHWKNALYISDLNLADFTAFNEGKSAKCSSNSQCNYIVPKNGFEPYDLRVLDVLNPDLSTTKYFISKRWDITDGQIVGSQNIDESGKIVSEEWSNFSKSNDIGFSGINDLVTVANESNIGSRADLTKKIHYINGYTYNSEILERDTFGFETLSKQETHDGLKKFVKTQNFHDTTNWVLGQKQAVSISDNGINFTQVNSTAFYPVDGPFKGLPKDIYRFGSLSLSNEYYSDGTLKKKIYNGVSNRWVSYSDYYRGIPRNITIPAPHTTTEISARIEVDGFGRTLSVSDFATNKINYAYTPTGRLTTIDPVDSRWDNTFIDYSYSNGFLTKQVSKGNLREKTTFDYLLRPKTTQKWDVSDEANTLSYINYLHDSSNKNTFTSVPSTNSLETRGTYTGYDVMGRAIKVTRPDGNYTTTDYLNGHQTLQIDAKGNRTTTSYLAYGAPSFENPLNISSPENTVTSISYNVFGNITDVSQGNLTENRIYDSFQRLCVINRPDVGSSAFEYNNLGEKISQVEGLSYQYTCPQVSTDTNKTALSYNNHGAISRIDYPDSSGDVDYTYNNNGELLTLKNGSASWAYEYNTQGLVELETLVVEGLTFRLDHQYNSLGQISAQVYPSGRFVDYNPNALGQARKSGGFVTQASYFSSGQPRFIAFGNGMHQRYTLNANDIVEDFTLSNSFNNQQLLNYRYSYDLNLNVQRIEDRINPNATINLSYDGQDRLTSASGIWGTGIISYDELGNIKTKSLGNHALSYNYDLSNNRLTSLSGSSSQIFSYDNRGNVIHNGKFGLTFNRSNQISSANGTSYLYDGHKRRVKKANANGVEYSFYSADGRLYSTQKAGVNTDYVYLGNQLVAKNSSSSVASAVYVHTDLLGSPVSETTSGGAFTKFHYKPFGESLEPQRNDVGYTGHMEDKDLGLTYMQQRYYDPVIGRFYSNDPVGFSADSPMMFNRYAYANNNPYKYTDPDGKETKLVTTYEFGVGTHSSLQITRTGEVDFLYDPAGSYEPSNGEIRGSGDFFEGDSASLSEFVSYHTQDGSDVSVVTIQTTPEQENAIKSKIIDQGGAGPGACASKTSSALKVAIPIEGSSLPGFLEEQVKNLTEKSK